MKRWIFGLFAAVLALAMLAAPAVAGVHTAQAGSAVVRGRIVYLSSAGVVAHATAVTHAAVGVCRLTQATVDANTRYAGVGEVTTVTSGELISVGDLLTGGTLGKAFALDVDDASTQRWVGIALTAASGADEDVKMYVSPGAAEQRLALASAAIGGGFGSTGVTISAAGVITANGAITSDGAVTGGSLATAATTIDAAGAVTGVLDVSAATVTYRAILNADVSASAGLVRSKLATETATYTIPHSALRNNDGSVVATAAGAGVFGIGAGGFGSGTLVIVGEAASANSKTDTLMFEFQLPPSYVAASAVDLQVTAIETVGAATVATTLSVEVYELDTHGAVGADLAGAPSVTDVTAAWQESVTAITAAGLVAGDRLVVFVRVVTNDTGGAVGTIAHIGRICLAVPIKG